MGLALSACASGPAVRGEKHVPVRSVVLYRSGVGYFERSGSFQGDSLTFQVKQDEVGDFLSSLTAVEHTQGGVRSVSFDVPEPRDDEDGESEARDERVKVKLLLGREGKHDVSVSYVVASPIWRPSYRVVLDADNQALLQAWAVVQNTSGEDWKDVRLSLTTGAPISFRTDLGTPITPARPFVTDRGEVVDAVPLGETALAQEAEEFAMDDAAPAPPPAPSAARLKKKEASGGAADMAEAQMAPGVSRSVTAAKPAAPSAKAMENSVQSMASVATLGESVTRYDLDGPVTVPDGSSTMVAILSQRVPGEEAHLFAPEPGVAPSYQHPFSVVRLSNATDAVLEKGPISVLGRGAFLGQGVLDTLPRGANAFVPFAIDKTVVVEPQESYGQEQGSLVRIQRGVVTVERFSQRKVRYRVRNGGDKPTKIYVRHARWGDAEFVNLPEGSELAAGKALIPIQVEKKGKAELEVVERTPVQVDFTFMDQPAADAVAVWLSGPAANDPQSPALRKALELRAELLKVQDQVNALEREQRELENSAEEARQNLRAIQKVASAEDLRARLVERLRGLDARLAELTKQLVEGRTRHSELSVRLNEALDGVSLKAR